MRLRALVLAAGLGSRLRPLTEATPKPLLPVAGKPILAWTLDRLVALGCEAVAVNLHHRGDKIRRLFGDDYRGLPLRWSEEEELLGTLGALAPLRSFFAAADLVLVLNGDSLCRWPVKSLVRKHQASGAQATLLLAHRPDPEEFGGGVGVSSGGRVVSLFRGDEERGKVEWRRVFAGAHVLSPSLLPRIADEPADFVSDLYLPLLSEGARIGAVVTGRRWHDLGTPRRYLEGALDWCKGSWPWRLWRRRWLSQEASVDRRATVRESAVEAGARIEAGARLERCLVLPGAVVRRGACLRESILGPSSEIPSESWVEGRVVVRRSQAQRAGSGDSLVGEMIFRRLGGRASYRARG